MLLPHWDTQATKSVATRVSTLPHIAMAPDRGPFEEIDLPSTLPQVPHGRQSVVSHPTVVPPKTPRLRIQGALKDTSNPPAACLLSIFRGPQNQAAGVRTSPRPGRHKNEAFVGGYLEDRFSQGALCQVLCGREGTGTHKTRKTWS